MSPYPSVDFPGGPIPGTHPVEILGELLAADRRRSRWACYRDGCAWCVSPKSWLRWYVVVSFPNRSEARSSFTRWGGVRLAKRIMSKTLP